MKENAVHGRYEGSCLSSYSAHVSKSLQTGAGFSIPMVKVPAIAEVGIGARVVLLRRRDDVTVGLLGRR